MKLTRTFATILLGVTLCFSLTAAAQTIIDFSSLPRTGVLLPIPNGYGSMNWGNFDYFTELLKTGTRNVAVPAFGSTSQTMSSAGPNQSFHAIGMTVVGQYNTTLTLYSYNRGSFVGSKSYQLAPVPTPLAIPTDWGEITQITFVCRDSQLKVAIYNLWSVTLQ